MVITSFVLLSSRSRRYVGSSDPPDSPSLRGRSIATDAAISTGFLPAGRQGFSRLSRDRNDIVLRLMRKLLTILIIISIITIFSGFSPVYAALRTSPLIIDNTSVAKYNLIPSPVITTLTTHDSSKKLILLRHASVGSNISGGLDTLATDGLHDRYNFVFQAEGNPGWLKKVDDFVTQTATQLNNFDVFTMKFCYIDNNGDPTTTWNYYRDKMLYLEQTYPAKTFVWWTMPLMTTGNANRDGFNTLVRNYAKANNKILFDIAAIESNGKAVTNGGYEAMDASYSPISDGGHLNATGAGLVAKAFWVMMAEIYATPNTYYVSPTGNDADPGTILSPWLTIQKAVNTLVAGDKVYVRSGQYNGIKNGWAFQNSGTESKPITFSNYPDEQVVLKIMTVDRNDYNIFDCSAYFYNQPDWKPDPKADYIHIIGTDVTTPRFLSNGVESKKGIVIQGVEGTQSGGMAIRDCDYWEVAGVDFVETANAIFTFKDNWGTMVEHGTDNWYVHNNRVYIFYREPGMQFNGDNNRIENNEIYKVTNRKDSPYGCVLINLLGDHNIVRGNVINRLGSTVNCTGIGFEWDLSDFNIIEQNRLYDVSPGIDIEGGDNNIIRNNIISAPATPAPYAGGIEIKSYDNTVKTGWPCDEPLTLLPANDPAHPDYQYYYNPRNCHSFGNQIYNNTIHGFVEGIRLYELAGENTIIRNNVFSGWTRGGVCFYQASNGTCKPLTANVTESNNATSGNFAFKNLASYDFHLLSESSLINAGFNFASLVPNLVPNDFDGNIRPQGAGYDIGAFEYISGGITPTVTPPFTHCIPLGDIDCSGKVNILDLSSLLSVFGSTTNKIADLDNSGKVNMIDLSILLQNFGK